MRVPIVKFSHLFHILQSETLKGSSVLVLVGFDVDALAGARLLKELFANRSIKSTTVPVAGMADLDNVYDSMVKENDELACIFMINCGGSVDLFEKLHLDEHSELYIFVADSHRPYHPSNVRNANNILILDDLSATEVSYDMTEAELQSLAKIEKDQVDEEEDDFSDDENSMDTDDGDEVGSHDSEEAIEDDGRRRRRRRKPRKPQDEVGEIAASDLSTHGFTAAGLLYAMALQIGINRKDLLWYSILGLTDQYVHQRIGSARYRGDLRFFAEKVRNFESSSGASTTNQQNIANSSSSVGGTMSPASTSNNSSGSGSSTSTASYLSSKPSTGSLPGDELNPHNIAIASKEYVFMLYRHWNLYDSMYHTRAIAVKLGVWGHQGKKNLEQWLARMGLPLEECKQKYVAMKKIFKDRLPQQLEKYAPEFNVQDIYVESFVKRPSFDKEISAFDVVYGASSLLESTRSQHLQETDTDLMQVDSDDDFLKANFWNAYRSLSSTSNILEEGIDEAIDLQSAIVRQVSSLIQRKDVLQMGRYRVAFIKDTTDLKYFMHPLALSKLAHFLVDTLIDMGNRPNARCKPLILTAFLPNDQCLLVGVEGQHSGSSHVPNRFGKIFATAATKTGIPLTYTSFDTSVIQIPKDDLERFREYLHSGYVLVK